MSNKEQFKTLNETIPSLPPLSSPELNGSADLSDTSISELQSSGNVSAIEVSTTPDIDTVRTTMKSLREREQRKAQPATPNYRRVKSTPHISPEATLSRSTRRTKEPVRTPAQNTSQRLGGTSLQRLTPEMQRRIQKQQRQLKKNSKKK